MDISVIIVTYNRCDDLRECLASIFRQTYPAGRVEVIVVDDGSTDRTPSLLKQITRRHPRVHCASQANQGPAAARNLGLKRASGEFIFFFDDDCWAEENLLERLMQCAHRHLGVAAFGVTTIPIFPQTFFQPLQNFFRNRTLRAKEQTGPASVLRGFGGRLSTDCSLVRASAIKAVGGFNVKFKHAGEDPDFWFRMTQQGYALALLNEPLARHHQRKSMVDQVFRHLRFGIADVTNFKDHYPKKFHLEVIHFRWTMPCPFLAVIRIGVSDLINLSALLFWIHPYAPLIPLACIFLYLTAQAGSMRMALRYLCFRYPIATAAKIGNLIGSVRQRVVVL
jgi:GT2 family glycosyltransferase